MESAGTHFEPLQIHELDPVLAGLPASPLELFLLFLPCVLIEKWVRWTNEFEPGQPGPGPVEKHGKSRRSNRWRPTNVAEVYLLIGILIFMSVHSERDFKTYWKTPSEGPGYSFTRLMPRNRFEILYRRLRVWCEESLPSSLAQKGSG